MKINLSLILLLVTSCVLSQNQISQDTNKKTLTIKFYGGISPLLSDEFSVSTPSQLNLISEYSYDVGYNAGISVGYFVTDNIAVQAGFENKSNRLFVPLNFGAQSNISDRSTKLTTNTIFFNGIYYLPVESKLRPYFGIGGALLQDITYNIFETDFTGSGEIGFRGLIGLDYTITEKLALNLEVNYNSFNEVEVQDGTNTIINLGYNPLTLNFGLIYAIKL